MNSLNNAILSIYDSALDLNHWSDTLDVCVQSVGSYAASLMFSEVSENSGNQWACVGGQLRHLDPALIEYYNNNFMQYERPAWELVLQHPEQTLVKDTDVWGLSDSVLLQREDFNYSYHKLGILRRVGARLNSYPVWSDNIAFQYNIHQTKIPENSLTLISRLLPHIGKSIEVGRSFELLRRQYKAVLSALDYVDVGLCIALENGNIIVSNAEAKRIFSERDGIELDRYHNLLSRSRDTTEELANAIRNISKTSSGLNSASEITLSINKVSSNNPYLIELSPLRDTIGELEKSLHGALIMIIDPENSSSVDVARLGLAYSLSKAEIHVARLLIDGWTGPNIAEERNVSIQTVKTQTSSIMRKTDTKKRGDLIRLAIKLSPPIRPAGTSQT